MAADRHLPRPSGTDNHPAGANALAVSNSLTDLAARIREEHEAVDGCMRQSLAHAIKTGELLIEAKAQAGRHGSWLPWLRDQCQVPARTAQMYMRLARNADQMRDGVADLTVREAVKLLADSYQFAVKHLAMAANRATLTLETPAAVLPSPTGRRKIRVLRNKTERKWMLAVGPDVSREALKRKEQAAREIEPVQCLQREHDDLIAHAAELEAEAKAMRERARVVGRAVVDQVTEIIGPATPFTETFEFASADEAADEALAAMKQEDLVDRLFAARDGSDPALIGREHGIWGDMDLMDHRSPQTWSGASWTRKGSPDWLKEFFPDIEEEAGTAD